MPLGFYDADLSYEWILLTVRFVNSGQTDGISFKTSVNKLAVFLFLNDEFRILQTLQF